MNQESFPLKVDDTITGLLNGVVALVWELPSTPSVATSNRSLARSIFASSQTGLIDAKSGIEFFVVRSQGHS